METEVTFNHSGIDFGEFLNSSNITTEPTSVEESFKWTKQEIVRLIQIIFRPIFIIVGTIGNWFDNLYYEKNFIEVFINLFLHGCFALADSSKYTI